MMIKKNWLSHLIFFILGVFFAIMISTANAENNSQQNVNSVHYETVYAYGSRYLVFIGPNGDIEIVK